MQTYCGGSGTGPAFMYDGVAFYLRPRNIRRSGPETPAYPVLPAMRTIKACAKSSRSPHARTPIASFWGRRKRPCKVRKAQSVRKNRDSLVQRSKAKPRPRKL